jgi:hypothetical protein
MKPEDEAEPLPEAGRRSEVDHRLGGVVVDINETLVESARAGSGIGTVYRALDELVDLYALEDAAVVVDVPGFGRHGLHAAPPGLYLQPPLDDPVLTDLMLALGTLAFRYDARDQTGPAAQ